MFSSLHLNQINILPNNQCDSEKLRYLSPPPQPPPSTFATSETDNASRIGKNRNDNNMFIHHRYHSRGEQISNDSKWSNGINTKGTVCITPQKLSSNVGKRIFTDIGGGAGINNTCKGIRCAVESVQCASALGGTHNNGGDTLTTVDSNFKCVSTLSGRATCAVLPLPHPLECVHRRCRHRERLTATSSIEKTEPETLTTAVDKHIGIGKHLGQASSTLFTNTLIDFITTTSTTTNTTSWDWESTSSVSSSSSVQDFAKCLTAEKKSISQKKPKNSLDQGSLLDNPCNFVISELYFSPFGEIFIYNLNTGSAVGVDSFQGLFSDSLGHFCHPKRIFFITNKNLHSQWVSSSSLEGANQVIPIITTLNSVHKFNYFILSACNLDSVLLFINNEVVNNLYEIFYFHTTPSPSSSSPKEGAAVEFRSKSLKVCEEDVVEAPSQEKEIASKYHTIEKISDGTLRNTSLLPRNEGNKNSTDTRQKASYSLLKVSDVQKKSDNNKSNSNDTERQCNDNCSSSTKKAPPTVSYKNNSHLVYDDGFRASQRLKRLEENFKDLTVVRKVTQRQPLIADCSVNGNSYKNRSLDLKGSFSPQQILLLTPTKKDRTALYKKYDRKSTSSTSYICDSVKLFQLEQREGKVKSSADSTFNGSDIIRSNNSNLQTKVINNFLSDNNNNLHLQQKAVSVCHSDNENINVSVSDSYVYNSENSSSFGSKSKPQDICLISRPVSSISEFDVRQLSDVCLSCDKTSKFCNATVTFECYDELLDDEWDEERQYAISSSLPNVVGDGCIHENVCGCKNYQKSYINKFPTDPSINNWSCNFHYPGAWSHDLLSQVISDRSAVIFDIDMRETNGQLRGLLKKPNRPPATHKNRVVFDETRNEFFEADYIILIREDCAYDEEDEEPCTCGEHELVRLCCEEGCQCNYTNEDTRTPQSPKFAPPIEFVDEAALSPPDGYKDNGLKNSLGGALSGHIFGAQHIQQLQVIQRLQQQRAAMLAARNNTQTQPSLSPPSSTTAAVVISQQPSGPAAAHAPASPHAVAVVATTPSQTVPQSQLQPHSPDDDSQPVCTECAECVECAAKQLQESECTSPLCQDEVAQLSVPTVALVPLHSSSPERRITQKEIIAGEERPKYVLQAQYKPAPVTERRIVREATEGITTTLTAPITLQTAPVTTPSITTTGTFPIAIAAEPVNSGIESTELISESKPPIPPKESSPTQISGILKGGKLWKQESISQSDDINTSSEDDTNAKRSVRFVTEDSIANRGDGQAAADSPEHDSQINELIPIKKHSTLFTNSLRPNSAVRQLFPSAVHQTSSMLTHEALRAFDESKRAGNLLPNLVGGNSGDSDTVRRSIERNILRRSLIKKKAVKSDISLEERIKQLTCDIDESNEDPGQDLNDENGKGRILNGEPSENRDSPTGEENPQQKYSNDKSFSPSSSVSSSSSGSSSAYKKISDIFNREKKQEKIIEMEENPIVIIPQECRCPAAPDLGMGIQVPVVHTQIHRTPPRQTEPKRQFLSTLAPLTACVAGQKDDLSYYTLAAAEGNSPANTHFAQYNMGDMEPILCSDEMRKVAPDVIAGTPGQEQDELAAFAQQEANRTEKIKKRYTNETSNASSEDDEQNDYGFNKRPSVRGIKPKFSSTNEILQQMQDQLNKSMPSIQSNNGIKSYTLPKQASGSSINKQLQNVQPQNQQIPAATAISQQQTERTWSFYGDPEQQRIPIDNNMHAGYYHTMPTVFQQTFQGQEETLMYQNCVTMEQSYGRYARSPTRRPESPPPLRNYHQTMVLIPYNAETYSQFAATSVDPKVAQIQRQNILEYQQVTQQTIRVPISYALPAMQLHVVAGRSHGTQQYVQHQQLQPQQQQQPQQRILAPRYSMPPEGTMNFSERGVPEGAAAASHTDCKGIVSPTSQANQVQLQQQQIPNCNQTTLTSGGPPGSIFYAMNV